MNAFIHAWNQPTTGALCSDNQETEIRTWRSKEIDCPACLSLMAADERTQIGNTPSCDLCGEQHGDNDCPVIPIGAMTEVEKQEYRLDQQDEAERESQHSYIPFHVLPPIDVFRRIEEHGKAIRQHLHTTQSTEVETIDITPESLKTPDGIAKVNAAMEAYRESREAIAHLATVFVMQHKSEVSHGLRKAGYDYILDDLRELVTAVDDRRKAEEAFLRAVAGR